ncbi:flotillin-like protein FloA [Anatilimnocola sp. NA78]|uniref:flotillin-like protein FloA n=1 Tax=Anatilimnocola sp. NA78 TaxID=3415683 RepID=UPI003CE5032B
MDSAFLLAQNPAQNQGWGWETIAILSVVAIAGMVLFFAAIAFAAFGKVWFQAYMSSADVSMIALVGMWFRQVNMRIVVQAKIMAAQAGLDINRRTGISTARVEAHYLAGGNVMNVIHAIIAAHRAGIEIDFDQAAAIDLAGRDVLDAVRTSVHPKVIDCPDPRRSGNDTLAAVAKDGIELRVKARVTVRTNLARLIGGATEDTVIARVGEGIITSIGSSDNYKDVLANPNRISRAVLDRGLDNQTAFEIVSIDIAHVVVGQNIGARLQADAAEADTRVARAMAEQRRSEAIAHEQEMKAKVAENRAALVEAEAQVPQAMAAAFEKGHLTVAS